MAYSEGELKKLKVAELRTILHDVGGDSSGLTKPNLVKAILERGNGEDDGNNETCDTADGDKEGDKMDVVETVQPAVTADGGDEGSEKVVVPAPATASAGVVVAKVEGGDPNGGGSNSNSHNRGFQLTPLETIFNSIPLPASANLSRTTTIENRYTSAFKKVETDRSYG